MKYEYPSYKNIIMIPFKRPAILLYIIIAIMQTARAQDPVISKELSSILDPSQNEIHVARDFILLKNGFQYKADGVNNKVFNAKTDQSVICNTPYVTSTSIPNLFTRELDKTLPVGSLAGSLNVTPQGAAVYSIPIMTPPGIGGISPSISVEYNSQSGNGIAGYGWNISGLSAITRVGKTIYNDGFKGGINLDENDRFKLDTNRLVLITPNTSYGQINTEYRTENETFSKITFTNDLNGNSYFLVETKEGLIIKYGITEDGQYESRVKLNGGDFPVLCWMISEVSDRYGNYMRYYYSKDYQTNEFRIDRIEYTMNKDTDIKPACKIKFLYTKREDVNNVYIADYKIQSNYLLDKILVSNENNLIHSYSFSYVLDFYSFLKEVKESGSDGNSYNSTIFNFGLEGQSTVTSGYSLTHSNYEKIPGDYNGDGYTDFVLLDDLEVVGGQFERGYRLFLNNKNNTFTDTYYDYFPTNFLGHLNYHPYTLQNNINLFKNFDINGDGLEDFLAYSLIVGTSDDVFVDGIMPFFSQGNSFTHTSTSGYPLFYDDDKSEYYDKVETDHFQWVTTGDYDGDCITDIVTCLTTGSSYFPAPASNERSYGLFYYSLRMNSESCTHNNFHYCCPIQLYTGWGTPDYKPLFVPKLAKLLSLDFNGDGKMEILLIPDSEHFTETQIYSISSAPNPYYLNAELIYSGQVINKDSEFYIGDFNGDGKSDLLTNTSNQHVWNIRYSTGTSFSAPQLSLDIKPLGPYEHIEDSKYYITIGDYNGDGKSDIRSAVSYKYWHIHDDGELYSPEFDVHYDTLWDYKVNYYIFNGNNYINYQNNMTTQWFDDTGVVGDFNGDGRVDYLKPTKSRLNNSYKLIYSYAGNIDARLLTDISNGYNNKTNIQYELMTSSPVYTKGSGSQAGIIDVQIPIPLVMTVVNSNEKHFNGFQYGYYYSGCKIHPTGKGFLGFEKITKYNINYNGYSEFTYNYTIEPDYCYYYLSKKEDFNNAYTLIKRESYTPGIWHYGHKRIFQYNSTTLSEDFLTGIKIKNTIEEFDFVNGNPLTVKAENLNGSSSVLASSITNYSGYINAGSVCLNKPAGIIITKTRAGQPDYVRSTSYTWNLITGKLQTETDDLNNITTYSYDEDYGQLIGTTLSSPGLPDKITSVEYDKTQRYPIKTINPLGHISEVRYDEIYGNKTWSKDPNNLITTCSYDAFGRPLKTSMPGALQSSFKLEWTDEAAPENSLYVKKTESSGKPDLFEYYEPFGQVIQSKSELFDTMTIVTNFEYSVDGLLKRKSYLDPYRTEQWITYTYDDNNRISTIVSPSSTIQNTYELESDGLVTTTNNLTSGITKSSKTNLTGLPQSFTDAGGSVNYTYNSAGLPITINVNGLNTNITYDDYGRQLTLTDPDAGTTSYEYYPTGELKKQTDAKGNINEFTYDLLSRTKTNTNQQDGIYSYNYDIGKGAIGQISSMTGPQGLSETYTYDDLGRPATVTENITGGQVFTTSYKYDTYGNVSRIDYPSGFSINQYYDGFGNLTEIKPVNDPGKSIWKLENIDYMGHVQRYQCGGAISTIHLYNAVYGTLNKIKTSNLFDYNYTFVPSTGNLFQRQDFLRNLSETFTYDGLNRLTQVSGSGNSNQIIEYEDNGNIKKNSHVSINEYIYNLQRPHAVETLEGDAVGSINSLPQNIGYNTFNKISQITEGDNKLDFTYGLDHERRKMQTSINNSLSKTLYYGNNYEKEVDASGNIKETYYIYASDGLTAMYVRNNNMNGEYYYTLKDHLGSIMGLYTVTGNTSVATLVEEYSYDAWGRRRNPTNWTYNNVPMPTLTKRGFTGHEHLDNFGLINMNGRLYDPVLARMLSPDKYVQDATITQNFNRYSYCLNNPLKYTDPSGYVSDNYISGNNNDYYDYDVIYADWNSALNAKCGGYSFAIIIGPAGGGGGTNPYALATVGAIALAADDVTGIGVVDDIAIPLLYAAAATYDLTQRVYLTYTLTNTSGKKYVGRTSGFGNPYSVMMQRYAGHHMKEFGYGNPTLDVWAQGAQAYPAIRGREQQLIDFYGGIGNVGNSIRGVGYYNPMGRVYYSASNLYFGPLAPYTGY